MRPAVWMAWRGHRCEHPTVVITNIRVSGINGIEFLARFKREVARVPVLILTAYEAIATVQQRFRLGASDYLTKPFQAEHLRSAVFRAIANAAEAQASRFVMRVALHSG